MGRPKSLSMTKNALAGGRLPDKLSENHNQLVQVK
jgi:hypothetical protein